MYSKTYNWVYSNLQIYILNVYERPYYICIQRLLLTLNGLDIMVTLGVYFDYINILCKIFITNIHITSLSKLSYYTY